MDVFRFAYVNNMDKRYKNDFLKNITNIDNGILDVVNEINKNNYLITINSCQGGLIEEEKHNHCPLTYVDFYALNHRYDIAEDLLIHLKREYFQDLACHVDIEADFDMDEYGDTIPNGYVNMRYRIEIVNPEYWDKSSIDKLVNNIKKFNNN